MTHEGGYSAATVPFFAHKVIETMAGKDLGSRRSFSKYYWPTRSTRIATSPRHSLIKEAEDLLLKLK